MIENDRNAKDQKMADPSGSPFTSDRLQSFSGLTYFEIDLKYRINAKLTRSELSKTVELTLTNGVKSQFSEFGILTFNFNNTDFKLTVFENQNLSELADNPDQVFIPFKDDTSGTETNTNGRYLSLNVPVGDDLILDFNRAFNPYNAYHEVLVSVIPPASNTLQMRGTTGERKYEDR